MSDTTDQFAKVLEEVRIHLQQYIQCEMQTKNMGIDCFLAGEFIIISIIEGKMADCMVACKFHSRSVMNWFVKNGAASVTRILINPTPIDRRESFTQLDTIYDELDVPGGP